jgi:Bacterial Ig-like domain (group 3)/Right handed beta helix region
MLIGNGNRVDRFDESTGAFIENFIPAGSGGLVRADELSYGPNGDLYVFNDVNQVHCQILRFDGFSGAFKDVFLDFQEPDDIREDFAFGRGSLYVVLSIANHSTLLARYDPNSGALENQVPIPGRASGMTMGPDGDLYIYQPNYPNPSAAGSSISRYDGQTLAPIDLFVSQDTRLVDNETQKPRFGPDGDLYVPTDANTVVQYDGKSGAFDRTFISPTGLATAPTNIGFAPDGSEYVVYWQGNSGNQGNVLHFDNAGGIIGPISNPSSWSQPRAITFSETVTTTADSGLGSLRQAIQDADSSSGDLVAIDFAIPGTGPFVISPTLSLPEIARPIVLSANTQAGFSGTPIVELAGNSAGPSVSGLVLGAGSDGSTIRGMAISLFTGAGIVIDSDSNTIQGNFLGTDTTGQATGLGNTWGVYLDHGSNNTIGGITATPGSGPGNVLSGNGNHGIQVLDGGANNLIAGNIIGLDSTGESPLPNGSEGVSLFLAGDGNSIGAAVEGATNIISENGFQGIAVSGTNHTLVAGNFVGTDITGTHKMGNADHGVGFDDSSFNTIGGTTEAARNVISGNAIFGLYFIDDENPPTIAGPSNNNLVEGNYIGVDATGTAALGNGSSGVVVQGSASDNTIGGPAAGLGNVISGNRRDGVDFFGATVSGNVLEGNFIGTNADGDSAIGNGNDGILIAAGASGNLIGISSVNDPASAQKRNVISGNARNGIEITDPGTSGNMIADNEIGTNADGTAAIANRGTGGVLLENGSSSTVIGTPLAGNVISGNARRGVAAFDVVGTLVQGNLVGLDATGSSVIPGDFTNGLEFDSGTATVGGTAAGEGNVISIGTGGPANEAFAGSYYPGGYREGPSGISVAPIGDFAGDSSGTLIEGNMIGTDIGGTQPLGNPYSGITISSSAGVTIGGTAAGAGNLIAWSQFDGIVLDYVATSDNLIQGNTIAHNGAAGGSWAGIRIFNEPSTVNLASTDNTIGGSSTGAANVITNNSGPGVEVDGPYAVNTLVEGNFIGTDASGSPGLGNSIGVDAEGSSTSLIENNVIASSSGAGVLIDGNPTVINGSATSNTIRGNSIHDNGGLGIDLGNDGVTLNHSIPTTGIIAGTPNGSQNFPIIFSSVFLPNSLGANGSTVLTGTFQADPDSTFVIELFTNPDADPSGYGEGAQLIQTLNVITDASGNAVFSTALTTSDLTGEVLTATATDPNGNTSEFGQDITVTSGSGTALAVPIGDSAAATQAELQAVIAAIQNLPAGTTVPTVVLKPATAEQLDWVTAALNGLSTQPAPTVTITVDLGGQTFLTDTTLGPPSGVNVVIQNGALEGGSPALTVTGGNVTLNDVTATNSTSAPTILVSGGSLVVRGSTIDGSTVPAEAALSITGGTADLGTSSSPGGNTLRISSGDEFVHNTTAGSVPTVGDVFVVNGTIQSATELSFTTLSSSLNPSTFGQKVTFTATVRPDNPGDPTPTGTVSFIDQTTGTILASVALSKGKAKFKTSALAAGTSLIIASYAGDSRYLQSLDDLAQTVNQAGTATALTSSTNTSVFGQSVTFTATVRVSAPGRGKPTGIVTFFDGSNPLGSGTLSAGGKATLKTTAVLIGSQMITAVYGGDANFVTSTSAVLTQTLNQDATTIKLTSSDTPAVYGEPVTFTAKVKAAAPGSGTPTGAVTFFDGTTTLGTGTLSGGVATYTTTAFQLNLGKDQPITAMYGGDANFTTSTSAVLKQTVKQSGTTTSVVSSVNPSVYGQSVTFPASTSAVSTQVVQGAAASASVPLGTSAVDGALATLDDDASFNDLVHDLATVHGLFRSRNWLRRDSNPQHPSF